MLWVEDQQWELVLFLGSANQEEVWRDQVEGEHWDNLVEGLQWELVLCLGSANEKEVWKDQEGGEVEGELKYEEFCWLLKESEEVLEGQGTLDWRMLVWVLENLEGL